MNPSPREESRPQSPTLISVAVVANIVWWMVMITGIFLGATNLNNCPVQPYIPIYVMVLGVSSLLALSLTYTRSMLDDKNIYNVNSFCMGLLHLFTLCWLITGTSWVYPVYPPSYTSGLLYCHKTTYQFAFIITALVWVTISLVLVCALCLAVVTCCSAVGARHRLIPNRNSFYDAIHEAPPAGDV